MHVLACSIFFFPLWYGLKYSLPKEQDPAEKIDPEQVGEVYVEPEKENNTF